MTALAVMNLLAARGKTHRQAPGFAGEDLLSLSERKMAHLRGNRISMIFQEPMTSLNPAYTIGSQLTKC